MKAVQRSELRRHNHWLILIGSTVPVHEMLPKDSAYGVLGIEG